MDEKLKDCPFCGGEAQLMTAQDGSYYVECDKCGASQGMQMGTCSGETTADYPLAADAAADWNSRAIAPPVAAGSVDNDHFKFLCHSYYTSTGTQQVGRRLAIVEWLDAWGAQQREAGRQEGKASNETLLRASVSEMDAMERERDEARKRAEKAEADLATERVRVQDYYTRWRCERENPTNTHRLDTWQAACGQARAERDKAEAELAALLKLMESLHNPQ